MNKIFAEFIGILLGDGYISLKDGRIKITLNSHEGLYIKYIRNLIYRLFNIKPIIKYRKDENTCDMFIFNKELIKSLLKIGMIESPKLNRVRIPNQLMNNNLSKYVLRGLFDTDGCLVITNNNGIYYPRIELKISPSPMQKQVNRLLRDLKFRFGMYKIGNGHVRIQLNGKSQVQKWIDEIGYNNNKTDIRLARVGLSGRPNGLSI